jgi:hypothetical protein
MWELSAVRELSIKELSRTNMGGVEQVLLGNEYRVPDWVIRGYNNLVRKRETLSIEDAKRLGWEETTRLLRIRDQHRVQPSRCYCHCHSLNSGDYTTDICTEFSVQLKDIGWQPDNK